MIAHLQCIPSKCCPSITALIVLDRYGIVNQWLLEEADPSCLLAHQWTPRFICSMPGCLSFPKGDTQHAPSLWLTDDRARESRAGRPDNARKKTRCTLRKTGGINFLGGEVYRSRGTVGLK
uniref:Uncharacterized protein n=1 Tax=Myripristis murdjan TaxID=586833 RepID=A0A667Z7H3_9TELE